MRRLFYAACEVLDIFVPQPLLIGHTVKHLERGDLVLVIFDELFEGLHQAFCLFQSLRIESCLYDPIFTHNINRLLALLLEFHEKLTKFRIVQGLYCFLDQRGSSLLNLRLARFCYPRIIQLRPFNMLVRINCSDKACAQDFKALVRKLLDLYVVLCADRVLHARHAHGYGGDHLGLDIPERDGLEQLLERHVTLLFHGPRIGLVLLAHAHGIDDDEMVLGLSIGSDCLQVVVINHAHAAALHLLEEAPGLYRAHEEHHFEGLDVRAGRDHVDGDGDARHGAGAELGDQVLGLSAGGLVGDLLAEVIAFCELFAHDLYDIFGMGVVLGKDERLGHPGSPREDLGQHLVLVGPDHGAYLVRRNNLPVQLVRIVG